MVKYLLVLDFEATCKENNRQFLNEIIEFPTLVIDTTEQKVIDKFHMYVRPVKNPVLSPFCTELTGIRQDMVENCETFPSVFKLWHEFIEKYEDNGIIVTCGDWDLKTMLPLQCRLSCMTLPSDPILTEWINIKRICEAYTGRKKIYGMPDMLEALNLKLEGRHHSGIDDCGNIARCAIEMLEGGAEFKVTTTRKL